MSKPRKPSPAQVKAIADKAEGIEPETRPVGRPSSYKPEYAGQAEKLCYLGATDMELADFFGVDVRTIHRWKADHPEFCHSLKTGKEALDERVERSLYHRAVGYTYDAEHFSNYQGVVTVTPYKAHVPPDTTAGIFWLKNRRSKDWRDVQRHEHGKPGDFANMSDDELRQTVEQRAQDLGLSAPESGAKPH